MQKIKVSGIPMAFSEGTAQEAAAAVAKRFGLIVEIASPTGPGGWPEVNLIGSAHSVLTALTEDGGWSTGDTEEDAEMVYHAFKHATELFG